MLATAAAQFVAPADGPVAFRRDRLPLDVDAISVVSRNLTALAGSLSGETPEQRRCAAQMIALALALDPSNAAARGLLDEFGGTDRGTTGAGEDLEKSRSRIWQTIGWLETPEAGADGKALAACLKDVMAVADPRHPNSEALRKAGETGAWRGWVPELASYRKTEPKPAGTEDQPGPAPAADKVPEVKLAEARLLVPLWQRIAKKDSQGRPAAAWSLSLRPLNLKVVPLQQKQRDLVVTVGSVQPNAALPQISNLVGQLLRKRHSALPKGKRLHITCGELEQAVQAKKRTSVSAASLVLAEAALSGTAPTGTVVALVNVEGGLGLPRGIWSQLRAVEESPPGRLVVPAAATNYLPSFLVLEKPEFFMKHQVLLASNVDDLLKLSSSDPGTAVSGVLDRFREIQEKLGSQDLRLYIGNRFVKQRLAEIVREAPWHFSARMLLTQASGERPVMLPRSVLAAELRRELQPLREMSRLQVGNFNVPVAQRAGILHETCRERVAALERYVARGDRELIGEADGVLDAVRDLERASRSRKSDNVNVIVAIQNAARVFLKQYKDYDSLLLRETGEAAEEN